MVTSTTLTNGMGGSATTSYNTASIAPSGNKLILIGVYYRRNAATPSVPVVTGNSLTWVNAADKLHRDSNTRFTIFRAMGASPTSGVVNILHAATVQMCHWHVISWDGVDTSGTDGSGAAPQGVGVDNANNTTSMSGSLGSAILSPASATYGGMGLVDVVTSISPGDSETELVDQTNNVTFNWKSQFQWKQGTDNNMAWNYTSGGNNPVGAFVEVRAAPDGGAFILFV